MSSRPLALDGSNEASASYTSDGEKSILVSVDWGEPKSVVGGRSKELVVKTEWKYLLNNDALSRSDVAATESYLTERGTEAWPVVLLMYL